MWLILLLLFLILIVILTKNTNNEHFDPLWTSKETTWNPRMVGKTSSDCYNESRRDCMKYSNCGLCVSGGNEAQCVPGDVQGPYFKEKCDHWAHTDYYDRYVFGEKIFTVTPSWSKFYPDYEAWYPSPIALS